MVYLNIIQNVEIEFEIYTGTPKLGGRMPR